MTVEYQETRWGRKHGSPKPVERGERVMLYMHPLHGAMFAKAARFDSSWRVTVIDYLGFGMHTIRPLVREQINDEHLKTSPLLSFTDLVLWRRKHFSYTPDA
ncbi:MAG: hypothetical protein AAB532_01125 [Patescibacteria group bacterium]